MTLQETSLIDLLPECMRDDRIIKGFAAAWDYIQQEALLKMPLINLFDNLELLTDSQLDQVAASMIIPWYNTEYEKEKKINLIRHYEKTCFKLGTNGSIRDVATDIFGDAEVQDWYQYDAPQFRFKIIADLGDYTTEQALAKLTRMVRDIKPAKATLSSVEFTVHIDGDINIGVAITSCYYNQPIYCNDIT